MANLTTTGFATEAVAVTPHNTDALTPTSALYVGVGGDLTVTMAAAIFSAVVINKKGA